MALLATYFTFLFGGNDPIFFDAFQIFAIRNCENSTGLSAKIVQDLIHTVTNAE